MLRANCPRALIGLAPTGECFLPKNDSPEAVETARAKSLSMRSDYVMSNVWRADPIFLGKYPERAKEQLGDTLYPMSREEWACVSQPLDFYGFNCYQGAVTRRDPGESSGYDEYAYQGSSRTAIKWNVTDEALYWSARFLYERYGKPLLVTENGCACNDRMALDGKVHDSNRSDFIHRYLLNLRRAVNGGIPVLGYQYWSLLDNFEWAEGYDIRFGLVYVDYRTQKRTVKDSAYWYKELIASNGESL